MFKLFSLLTLIFLLNACAPDEENSSTNTNSTDLLDTEQSDQDETDDTLHDDLNESVDEEASPLSLELPDYPPSCDDQNIFTFLHDANKNLKMIYLPDANDEILNFRLVTVDQNDEVSNIGIANEQFVDNETNYITGFVNEDGETCIHTNFYLAPVNNKEIFLEISSWQKNYCQSPDGAWYLYETDHYPLESGVNIYGYLEGEENRSTVLNFIESNHYPAFDDFNISDIYDLTKPIKYTTHSSTPILITGTSKKMYCWESAILAIRAIGRNTIFQMACPIIG